MGEIIRLRPLNRMSTEDLEDHTILAEQNAEQAIEYLRLVQLVMKATISDLPPEAS